VHVRIFTADFGSARSNKKLFFRFRRFCIKMKVLYRATETKNKIFIQNQLTLLSNLLYTVFLHSPYGAWRGWLPDTLGRLSYPPVYFVPAKSKSCLVSIVNLYCIYNIMIIHSVYYKMLQSKKDRTGWNRSRTHAASTIALIFRILVYSKKNLS
jgi:hypothetical protein